MLFTRDMLAKIAAGRVDLAFRSWRRPGVRCGTRLRTEAGVVEIGEVTAVTEAEVSERDALRAGFADRAALLADLRPGDDRRLYRIGVRLGGEDPRVRLREDTDLSAQELEEIVAALRGIDARSRRGPWTRNVLELVRDHPGERAAELAALAGRETVRFKADVRVLRERGLTESLAVGYRLSPRGRLVLEALRKGGAE
ncbi:hypothetical protein GL263_03320 [Streptomyces durbertensis]|uniref:ASCH domain-containing protein n=1 Tax=Streptomyces durbertensis TaxID=2448886 RepID=A0ABR6EB95_9ACTN|nr:hypothetical protein [Streptomyces durbertensis]MBB1242605.1 hypothetical protein [Streptomyces durbertensis]